MSSEILKQIINPALDRLTGFGIPPTGNARAMLLAIAGQESNLEHRFQISVMPDGGTFRGPARGLWQFEAGGGVAVVMTHSATAETAKRFVSEFVGSQVHGAVWAALAYEDVLAAIFARLLLWTDPLPLPAPIEASEEFAWQYYLRNWRPGKPHRNRWPGNWIRALDILKAARVLKG